MSQVRYESIERMRSLADKISSQDYPLLLGCIAIVEDDNSGMFVLKPNGVTVSVGLDVIIRTHLNLDVINYINDHFDILEDPRYQETIGNIPKLPR